MHTFVWDKVSERLARPWCAAYDEAMPYRVRLTGILLLAFVLVVLLAPLLIPVPALTDTVAPRSLADADSHFVMVDDLNLHYKTSPASQAAQARAPQFVLLHGFGNNLETWSPLVPALRTMGEVIRVDQIGFGRSEKPVRGAWQRNPYTMAGQVAALESLMEHLNLADVVLVSHGSSANIALRYALTHQQDKGMHAMIFVAPSAYSTQAGAPDWARPLLFTPQANRVGVLPMRQFAGEAGEALYTRMWAKPERISSDALARQAITSQTLQWDRALWEYSRYYRPPRFEAGELESLSIPSLVLMPTGDQLVAAEEQQALATALSGALQPLDDCGHLAMEECPAQVAEAIATWLATQPRLDNYQD